MTSYKVYHTLSMLSVLLLLSSSQRVLDWTTAIMSLSRQPSSSGKQPRQIHNGGSSNVTTTQSVLGEQYVSSKCVYVHFVCTSLNSYTIICLYTILCSLCVGIGDKLYLLIFKHRVRSQKLTHKLAHILRVFPKSQKLTCEL